MTEIARDTVLFQKTLGCLIGGIVGDAMGTPTENLDYREIERRYGWVETFEGDGTDDTILRDLLAEALARTSGYATLDDWAAVWLERWATIFGDKRNKFFISVLHAAQKLKNHSPPREAALGNMPSSSSAMCIAPVGVVNAANPHQAALQAYNLASLIHVQDVGFCQDAAAAIAAAVAGAFVPGATVESVIGYASRFLLPTSGQEMRDRIAAALDLAREAGEYRAFRQALYEQSERFFCRITCDSRETVPLALAVFLLADGDVAKSVVYSANLGRDADTIGAMAGGLAGALQGIAGIPNEWLVQLGDASTKQEALAGQLVVTALKKAEWEKRALARLEEISS